MDIYKIINEPIDIIYKFTAINRYKEQLSITSEGSFGEYYFESLKAKKESGTVYTPEDIATYIIRNTISAEDIINNPKLKIIDPACGCGNFIIPCFKYLKDLYSVNLTKINAFSKLELKSEHISKHIIENNLFGFDIDEFAIKVLMIDLFAISEYVNPNNFSKQDFLIQKNDENYDIILGNPPYIGFKNLEKDYYRSLKELYMNLYKDKGDISYCFFGAALNSLKSNGKLSFITSRYFIESPSGEALRRFLKDNCKINSIVDFYGIRPFKNTGVDPVIILASKENTRYSVEVKKPRLRKEASFCSDLYNDNIENIDCFYIGKEDLKDSGWVLRNDVERRIISKIEDRSRISLVDIFESYQGIITGCDKAFIVDKKTIIDENLENELLKPWIKSSYIGKNKVKETDKFIIYADRIYEINKYPHCIKHIEVYKTKLQTRRECKKGTRLWYKLQWGRVQSIFEGEKVIFPFKASSNKFAYDCGSYFSADVYCLILKDSGLYTYDFIIKLLNSKLYEYYFKTFAKKLGENLYDYYPNNLMKLRIPRMQPLPDKLDEFLYSYFKLTSEEIRLIEQYVN